MNENSTQPAEGRGRWWFAWILATIVIPGSAISFLLALPDGGQPTALFLFGVVTFILHIVSSIKLDHKGSGLISLLLVFGGWVLMVVSLFVGCVVLVSRS
jgi:hypothetical protein